jgi:hypothetical protein
MPLSHRRCSCQRPTHQRARRCFGSLSTADVTLVAIRRMGDGSMRAGGQGGHPPNPRRDGTQDNSSPGEARRNACCLSTYPRDGSCPMSYRCRQYATSGRLRYHSDFRYWGTFEACRRTLRVSVCRGRPEVIGAQSNRRDCPKASSGNVAAASHAGDWVSTCHPMTRG